MINDVEDLGEEQWNRACLGRDLEPIAHILENFESAKDSQRYAGKQKHSDEIVGQISMLSASRGRSESLPQASIGGEPLTKHEPWTRLRCKTN